MSEKPKATKPQKPHLRPGYEHYGEPGPIKYGDGLGKKVGGWLAALFTSLGR